MRLGRISNDRLLDIQDETVAVLGDVFQVQGSVALLDFPRHKNAGDSLIWTGARQYLSRMRQDVTFSSTLLDFRSDDLRQDGAPRTLVINGGGNFGDRWIYQQAFREKILTEFRDRTVVQLPCSLEFRDGAALERARRIVGEHPDFTILVRDRDSYVRATEWFDNARIAFCHDMAYGNGLLPRSEPHVDVVALMREDSESIHHGHAFDLPEQKLSQSDWRMDRRANAKWLALRMPENVSRVFPLVRDQVRPAKERSFERMARLNVSQAVKTISNGRLLITDRLHAAVTGQLLGLPVVALDNSNGKIRAAFESTISRVGGVAMVADLDEARRIAQAHLSLGDAEDSVA